MATSDYSSTFTSSSDGECLFQSPAQIMVRQEIGWEPMGLGGLSRIEVKQKQNSVNKDKFEYYIEAYKIADSNEKYLSLECKLDSDTSYFRISPTFHCWTTKNDKIGLTFDTFEAAESFEKLFHHILKKLDKGNNIDSDGKSKLSENKPSQGLAATKEDISIKTWGSCQHIRQADIPCTMKCFQSPPTACSQLHTYINFSPADSLSRHYRSPSAASAPCLLRLNTTPVFETIEGSAENDSSTQVANSWLSRLLSCVGRRKACETNRLSRSSGSCSSHHRPNKHPRTSQDGPSFNSAIQESSISNDRTSMEVISWLPAKRSRNHLRPGVLICVYCRRRFRPQSNPPGSCELAPDRARYMVDLLTCRPCGMHFINRFYRSVSHPSLNDPDLNDSLPSPCKCCSFSAYSPGRDSGNNLTYTSSTHTLRPENKVSKSTLQNRRKRLKSRSDRRKRCLVCLMYCFLPCLCCYRPCLACYESCLERGFVGGRHSVVHHRSQH